MLPARWNDVKDRFEEALLLEPALRAVYLAELGAEDPELREELESLIAAHERSGSYFLNAPLANVTTALTSDIEHDHLAGRRIGSYQIIRQIGAGGMGEVYSAFRSDGQYWKLVAIKLVRSGQGSDFVFSRFKNERQILASLDHPNIARLFDGGTTEEGMPYFVMELIEGQAIDEYCFTRSLSITDRLNLFLQVCSAVQFAHQHLVIHRDIKPGNILVTSDGVPKLLDFGIAKILEGSSAGEMLDATLTAFRVLTPGYASPEQIKGEPIATASDVYSLGVVLYKLLTGRSPYRLTSGSPHEVSRAVCECDPEKPSVAVRRLTNGKTGDGAAPGSPAGFNAMGYSSPRKLSRRLSGDIDNIVLKALRKEPRRRYISVEQFHGDITRHLDNVPVIARESTFRYRSWKFINRYRVGVIATGAIGLIMISALIVTLNANRVRREQPEIARYGEIATLLGNGKVLVTGGSGTYGGRGVSSAQLYTPMRGARGTFAPTDSLLRGVFHHTATLLPSGKVLIAGGQLDYTAADGTTQAEVYDPATATFTATVGLTIPRQQHTATLLQSGLVLIVGGYSQNRDDAVSSAELYDPVLGTFTSTIGNLATARYGHTATLLRDGSGKVLIVGGYNFSTGEQSSAEIYDPATQTFSSTGNLNVAAGLGSTATLLPSGRVLIAAGINGAGVSPTASTTAELYNPTNGTFTQIGSLTTGRWSHTATLEANGKVLFVGGQVDKKGTPTFTAELYDPSLGIFTPTVALNTARYAHAATLLSDGTVVISGGVVSSVLPALNTSTLSVTPSVEFYSPVP